MKYEVHNIFNKVIVLPLFTQCKELFVDLDDYFKVKKLLTDFSFKICIIYKHVTLFCLKSPNIFSKEICSVTLFLLFYVCKHVPVLNFQSIIIITI